MKDRLIQLINTLLLVETKGNSTCIMADCIRELQNIINTMESEVQNELRD